MPNLAIKNMNNKELEELAEYCASFLKETVKTDRKLAASLLITILENHNDLVEVIQ